MEKFEILMLGLVFGSAIGYLVRYITTPMSKEEYEERLKAKNKLRESQDRHHYEMMIKIKELDEADKALNRIIRH